MMFTRTNWKSLNKDYTQQEAMLKISTHLKGERGSGSEATDDQFSP